MKKRVNRAAQNMRSAIREAIHCQMMWYTYTHVRGGRRTQRTCTCVQSEAVRWAQNTRETSESCGSGPASLPRAEVKLHDHTSVFMHVKTKTPERAFFVFNTALLLYLPNNLRNPSRMKRHMPLVGLPSPVPAAAAVCGDEVGCTFSISCSLAGVVGST